MRISDCSSDVCSSYLNHAGAQHFHPSFRPANDALPLLHRITDIDLPRRFSEGVITGPQTKNDVVTLKKCLQKGLQRPFEKIGRAHVCTPLTNAHLVCRLLLDKQSRHTPTTSRSN